MKTGIGLGVAVLMIGAWVSVKTFSGKAVGEECHAGSDTDCKGWSAQCLTSQAGSYCSSECKLDTDCPTGWACGAVGLTVIDAKGNTSKRDSNLRMCHKGAVASVAPPAATTPPVAASAPVAPAASTVAVASLAPPPGGAPHGHGGAHAGKRKK